MIHPKNLHRELAALVTGLRMGVEKEMQMVECMQQLNLKSSSVAE